ncbi:hypothetical protein [Bifidobacterium longum]|uniref:hypothetical protein n=1 Tax=Bifidobacterium longum TaxID=216816 RepID=UPI0020CABE22|nr:hypothetical protein [Bifidobacterium longum]
MVELVTGHAGKAHATAEQAAGLNAGILGLDDYVLNVHDKFKITVVSANKVTIGTGELVMQGRHVSQGTPEDLIVTNGSQGQKRNDLIVCRYAKGSQSIESAKLVVVRGTPTTGTPTDPALNTTSPLDGGTTYDMPLYRIPLDGITIGTPVALFNVLKPMSDVWDSLTPAEYAPYIQCAGHTVTTGDDGTFWVGVKSPNGKPPDYASYTVGPFGTGFNDEDGIIAHLWDVTATGVRFRLYTTRYQRWCGKTAIFGKWITVWRR